MKTKFNLITGYSDHTIDDDTALISVCLGSKFWKNILLYPKS